MKFLGQGFQKLQPEHDRQAQIHVTLCIISHIRLW